jgi:hypothetical protein
VAAAFSFVFRIEAKVDQRVMPLAGFHHNVSAFATVSAGRTAPRDEFLPPKSHATVAAPARLDSNFCFINEHDLSRCRQKTPDFQYIE